MLQFATTTVNSETTTSPQASVTTLLWLLVAVAVVAVTTKYIRLPYTIALVLVGIVIALIPGIPAVVLTPELILLVFLPVLLFEAAYHLSFDQLRANFRFIASLAVWGVVATALLIAFLLQWWGGLSWQTSLLFGAIVAATDPISVVATFRKMGLAPRLTSILESESLFNDGSALVLFNLLLNMFLTQKFDFWGSVAEFLRVSIGGLALGAAVGYLALFILSRFDDYLTEILITLIVAYGVFLLAEKLNISPALAVVTAGLLVGNFGLRKAFSPTSQLALGYSWEFFGFLTNSLIFLLMGLQIRLINFTSFGFYIALAIIVTLVGRTLVVAFLSWLSSCLDPAVAISWNWQVLLVWGGLRGALSLAMALGLPLTFAGSALADRNMLLAMTFGVIMFSLLVQGLTIEPLAKIVREHSKPDQLQQLENLSQELVIVQTLKQIIEEQLEKMAIPTSTGQFLIREYGERAKDYLAALAKLPVSKKLGQQHQWQLGQTELTNQQKQLVSNLYVQGLIDEEVLHRLLTAIEMETCRVGQAVPNSSADLPASEKERVSSFETTA